MGFVRRVWTMSELRPFDLDGGRRGNREASGSEAQVARRPRRVAAAVSSDGDPQ
jgi:hypothetical protein